VEHLETERKRECEQFTAVFWVGDTTQQCMLGRLAPDFKQAIYRFWERKGSVGILTRLLGDRNHGHDVGVQGAAYSLPNILPT
jgi:hypothetical protein